MTSPVWAETDGTWVAYLNEARLLVRKVPGKVTGTDEWTWVVRFPDGREVVAGLTVRRRYLTRKTAQAAAERAAAGD